MKARIVKIDGKYRVCSSKTGKPLAKHYSSWAEAWDARMELRKAHYEVKEEEE